MADTREEMASRCLALSHLAEQGEATGTWDASCVQLSSHDLAHVSSRWQSRKTDEVHPRLQLRQQTGL